MARQHGKPASTSRDPDVSPPEYRQCGPGNPGALSRGTQRKRAEQIAKHNQRILADLEEEAENKWHFRTLSKQLFAADDALMSLNRRVCLVMVRRMAVAISRLAPLVLRGTRVKDYAVGRSDGIALRGDSNVLISTIRPGVSCRSEGGQRRASSNNGILPTNASGSTVAVSEVVAGGTDIRKDTHVEEKIKKDRARREVDRRPRPEAVYAALERKDVFDMSDINHVVAGIIGLSKLFVDAMSQIFLVTSKGVKAKDLVPVL